MSALSNIKGILFDLDGVLYVGTEKIEGALETLDYLKQHGLDRRFITNTSTTPASTVASKLRSMGFAVADEEIFSAVSATRDFLRARGATSVRLLVQDSVRPEFSEFRLDDPNPEFVVVGDIGAAWDYPLLNGVFNELMSGAELIAMHRNKYWQTQQGLQMDIGAFVAGLEYVTGKQATVIGKPSRDFFTLAIESLGLDASQMLVVGDDIENDIGGGQACDLYGVLVKTGKYRDEVVESSAITPDAIIGSIADLPALLEG